MYYYGARYYAAWTCRFISIDPLASDYVHLTPYNNAGNKPINSFDIDGLQGATEQLSGGTPQITAQQLDEVIVTANRIPTDQVSEKAKGSGWTRFWGGVKAVFGTIESAPGVALTSTGFLSPLGAILFIHGADVASSGFRQVITGEKTETLTYQGARKVSKAAGASDETATGIASGFDMGISLLSLFAGSVAVSNAEALPKVVTKAVAAKAESLVKIGTVEGDVMIFSSKIGTETIEGITNFAVKDGKLYLNQLHLQGSSAGNVGRESLWNMAKDLGRQYNVKEVIIQGGKRTTGKYKGQVPSPKTIKVD